MSNPSPMLSQVRELVGAEVLVIDQDQRVRKGITQLLSAASLHVTCVSDPADALRRLDEKFFSVVVVDLDTPTPNAGVVTINQIKEKSPTSMIVVLTPRTSYNDVVAAIRAGAIDIILKSPEQVQYLKDRVLEAAGRSVDKREVSSVLSEVKALQDEFLQHFMQAERRALDLSDKLAGRDPDKINVEEIRVLVVDDSAALAEALGPRAPAGFTFETALTGGEALDRVSSSRFHIVMVASMLPDLPGTMVVKSVKTQNPEVVGIQFSGPNPPGKVEIIESTRTITVLDQFSSPEQLIGKLDELAEAFRAKARERRYTQAFRERHFDFLRKYVELKSKIDRALMEGR